MQNRRDMCSHRAVESAWRCTTCPAD